MKVLIAGIGGASLGVEIAKSLCLAGGYTVYGADISNLAFGHFSDFFDRTFHIDSSDYVDALLHVCDTASVDMVVAGGDQPARLIAKDTERFVGAGIKVAGNAAEVVNLIADKGKCFERLASLNIAIPRTLELANEEDCLTAPLPAIVKPSLDSGGSAFVFFARNTDEVRLYAAYLRNNGLKPIAQAYIGHEGGEFTVGVLSSPQGKVEGVIALKRAFHVKLSVAARGRDFLISSGYSQGRIDLYPDICVQAKLIAEQVGSRGPLNIQGRINADGVFVPFEINPRFSASNYLRAMAGFNEVDFHIRQISGIEQAHSLEIKPGWYLRGLTEVFASDGHLK